MIKFYCNSLTYTAIHSGGLDVPVLLLPNPWKTSNGYDLFSYNKKYLSSLFALLLLFFGASFTKAENVTLNEFTSKENCWTVIVDISGESHNNDTNHLNTLIRQLESYGGYVVVFSPLNIDDETRLPTLDNIRSLLDWVKNPDEANTQLNLGCIRQKPNALCEIRLFITAFAGKKDEKDCFFFPDENSSIPIQDILDALNGMGTNQIERRLLFVNLLSRSGKRSIGRAPQEKYLPGEVEHALIGKKRTRSEGLILVKNQNMGDLNRIDNFYHVLNMGLNGRADGFSKKTSPDGIVSMYELIDYVRTELIKDTAEKTGNCRTSHMGSDYGIATSQWSEKKAPAGLFLDIASELDLVDANMYKEDIVASLNREIKNIPQDLLRTIPYMEQDASGSFHESELNESFEIVSVSETTISGESPETAMAYLTIKTKSGKSGRIAMEVLRQLIDKTERN